MAIRSDFPIWRKAVCFLPILILVSVVTKTVRADDLQVFHITAGDTPEDCIADRTTPACALAMELQAIVISAQHGLEGTPIIASLRNFLFSIEPDHTRKEVVVPAAIDYRITSFHIYGPNAEAEFLDLHPGWAGVPEQQRPSPRIEPGTAEIVVDIRYYDAHGLAWPPPDWPEFENWQRETYRFQRHENRWEIAGSGVVRPYHEITQTSELRPCTGESRTPLCAVESYIACRIRNEVSLCEAADQTYPDGFEPWEGTESFLVEAMVWDDRQPIVTIRLRGPALPDTDGYSLGLVTRYSVTEFGDQWKVTVREIVSEGQ